MRLINKLMGQVDQENHLGFHGDGLGSMLLKTASSAFQFCRYVYVGVVLRDFLFRFWNNVSYLDISLANQIPCTFEALRVYVVLFPSRDSWKRGITIINEVVIALLSRTPERDNTHYHHDIVHAQSDMQERENSYIIVANNATL